MSCIGYFKKNPPKPACSLISKTLLILSLFAISILSAPSLTAGEDWIAITKNKDGSRSVFIDRESIKHTSGHAEKDVVRVSGKITYKEPEPINLKYLSYSLENYEFYCSEKSFRTIQLLYYYTDGTKESQVDPKARQWKKIEPGTAEEVMYRYLCERDK